MKYIKLDGNALTNMTELLKRHFSVGERDKISCIECRSLAEKILSSLPTIEVSEEDELKFYYVESIDDYWIGQRLDNFYYAKWNGKLGFVWSASRYLPWGEHVVDEQTLWKEHTYPSEPREIPFTEWIVGFMKKYGSKVSEDAISREWAINKQKELIELYTPHKTVEGRGQVYWQIEERKLVAKELEQAPSVIPSRAEGEWIHDGSNWEYRFNCTNCGYHLIGKQTKFCPNCRSRMKGAE